MPLARRGGGAHSPRLAQRQVGHHHRDRAQAMLQGHLLRPEQIPPAGLPQRRSIDREAPSQWFDHHLGTTHLLDPGR